MKLTLLVVLGAGILYCLHRLGLWAEERGWIYYHRKRGSSGTLSSAFLEVQSLLEPSKRYVLEERTRDEAEGAESGDQPTRQGTVACAAGVLLLFAAHVSHAQDRFPTMASQQGRMPCGSCQPPSTISWQAEIAPPSEPGDRLVITGTVYEPDGVTPAPEVTLFVFHTDAKGHYNSRDEAFDPRLRGWARTAADGRYELRTIRPGPYPQVTDPAHIHAHVYGPGRPEWFIPEYWFEGDPLIPAKDRDLPARLGRFSPIVRLAKDREGAWRGQRDIRLEKPASR